MSNYLTEMELNVISRIIDRDTLELFRGALYELAQSDVDLEERIGSMTDAEVIYFTHKEYDFGIIEALWAAETKL